MPTTVQSSQLVSVPISEGKAAALQGQWTRIESETAGGYAYLEELIRLFGPRAAAEAVGGAPNMRKAWYLLQRFERHHEIAKLLSSGSAVLVAYTDPLAAGVHIGVYPRSKLPQQGFGLVWKYITLAAGVVLVAGYFFFRSWELELRTMQAETDELYLKVARAMNETVKRVGAKDPAAAARIAEANAKALQVAADARKEPQGWLDKILGTVGDATPWLWVAAGVAFIYYSQQARA